MTANLTLLVVVGALVACGVYLILERSVTKMLLGMILFGNAVNLLILTVAGPDGEPPLRSAQVADADMADPLAQAMVLTAIVITMGLTAFVLALAYRARMLTTTDDVPDDAEDADVAGRREREDPED
ncbi:Na(+)/H(+) antiporter subunit C [Nocardia harenae]|uniref:Na(+)/H(+) antiporter subunit C n=1 Tax=Nocardia harenae TaxID=358707 RepID=UPI00083510CC|nr:Na(+)/H(+) antiporter subunit C [Nocardia harenae]